MESTAHPHPSYTEMEAAFISLKSVLVLVHSLNRFRLNTPVRTHLGPKGTSVNRPAEFCVLVACTSQEDGSQMGSFKICRVSSTRCGKKIRDLGHSGVGQWDCCLHKVVREISTGKGTFGRDQVEAIE